MSNEPRTSAPWSIHEQTRVKIPLVLLVTLCGVASAAAVVWSGDHNRVAEHEQRLDAYDARLQRLDPMATDIEVIKAELKFIRLQLEQLNRRDGRE